MVGLPRKMVEALVRKYEDRVQQIAADKGVDPRHYLRDIFETPEFMVFMKMLGSVQAAYEDDIRLIIKEVLPDVYSESLEWW